MIKNTHHNQGYVGLIVIMITVAIMAFLMIRQYESLGFTQSVDVSNTGVIGTSTTSGSTSATSVTPIERAKNMKNLLEAQDRNRLSQ